MANTSTLIIETIRHTVAATTVRRVSLYSRVSFRESLSPEESRFALTRGRTKRIVR